MNALLGGLIPLAVGVAISPVPIIAVILMLLTPNAGGASRGFLLGWLTGIIAALLVFALLAGSTGIGAGGGSSTVGGVLKLGLGALLLVLAVAQWRSRPRPGAEPQLPGWLKAVDKVTPIAAIGLGLGLSAVNPKNLVLLATAGVDLGGAGLPAGSTVLAGTIFVLLAASTVLVPVLGYALARDRVRAWLESLKSWLTANNAVVMTVLLAVMGAVVFGKGLAAL